ncbi:hypothetical protein D8674_034219 [Pyrus ussuriensis x Pyrus communis]|uniref:Reverse transcriptase Ty1/copia-type domain-containing protein n=1 Tax=Pyrus ussuriensis x Pyrus communis TaxID=2448454 RepID=A0A5N5I1A0_9ROSA|nr:hypothetical protein D8674_034219 [Pyrus ussuriensis x Pyrus communis]
MVPIKLKSSNYLPWRALFAPILRRYKLLGVIDGTKIYPPPFLADRSLNPAAEEWYEKDQNLLIWLNSTLSEEIIPFTVGVSSFRELWVKLEQRFGGVSEANIHQLRSRLQSVQKGSNSISVYLQQIKEIADSLHVAGSSVSDRDLIAATLHGLPDEFESFIDSIMLRLSSTSLDELHGLLLTKELSMARRKTVASVVEPFQAFSVQSQPHLLPTPSAAQFSPLQSASRYNSNRGKSSRGQFVSNRGNHNYRGNFTPNRGNRIYQGSRNHSGSSHFKAIDCFDRMNPEICGRIPPAKLAAMCVHHSAKSSQPWLIDSGATSHITNDVANLSSPTPYTGEDKVYVGNGKSLSIHNNVLHVPSMAHNLVSAYQFLKDNNCSLTLDPYGSTVKDRISGRTLLRGMVKDGFYPLPSSSNSFPTLHSAFLSVKAPVQVWHRRLGHPSSSIFRRVISTTSLAVHGKSTVDFFCSDCALAKNHKLPFGVASSTTTRSLQLLHCDLWGPASVKSSSGFQYYLLLVDDFSKYSWFFLLKAKSDSLPLPPSPFTSVSPVSSSSMDLSFTKYTQQPLPAAAASSSSPSPSSSIPDAVVAISPPTGAPPPGSSVVSPSAPGPLPVSDNAHPMVTRSKAGIYKPKAYAATKHPLPVPLDFVPSTYLQASKHAHWRAAMQDEYNALLSTGTWSLVPSHSTQNVVGCKWVFRIKTKADGTVDRYKARLVAKGFHKKEGVDFHDTFSPVAKPVTIRILLTLDVQHNWFLNQLDISNAFLHGDLHEDVYMQQPPGFTDPLFPSHVCKLRKSLYGLKQAPRAWFDKLFQALQALGFTQSSSDASLFVLNGPHLVIVLVYVDDILVTGPNSNLCHQFITQLSARFPVKDLGPLHYFLGLEVQRSTKGIFLHQTKYLLELLKRTNMEGAKPCCTPLGSQKLDHSGPLLSNPTAYRSLVGGLQYLTWTRPDLAFAVNQLCQFMHAPRDQHFQAAKRVLRFLKGSHTRMLIGLAGCTFDRRSTSGYCVFLCSNLISWSAKKQSTVARSSTEVCKILRDLHCSLPQLPTLWCDNLSAISLASNPVFHARTKHIELDYHYIRELVLAHLLKVQFVCSEDQLADLHTKSLSKTRFRYLCSKLPLGINSDSTSRLRGCIRTDDQSSVSVEKT